MYDKLDPFIRITQNLTTIPQESRPFFSGIRLNNGSNRKETRFPKNCRKLFNQPNFESFNIFSELNQTLKKQVTIYFIAITSFNFSYTNNDKDTVKNLSLSRNRSDHIV